MFTKCFSGLLLLMASLSVQAEDNYTLYTIKDFLDINEYFEEYSEQAKESGVIYVDEMFYYQDLLSAGVGRRIPITDQVILRTDSAGELSQYIVYLSQLADKPHFNCKKINSVFQSYYLPRRPAFYINDCDPESISFYRSTAY